MSVSDDFINAIKGAMRAYLKDPKNHENFLVYGLVFDPADAARAVTLYHYICYSYGVAPGMGIGYSYGSVTGYPAYNFEFEATKIGLGQFATVGDRRRGQLKLADYLKDYPSYLPAVKALTPAKRDALRGEVKKMFALPERAFTTGTPGGIGVRG